MVLDALYDLCGLRAQRLRIWLLVDQRDFADVGERADHTGEAHRDVIADVVLNSWTGAERMPRVRCVMDAGRKLYNGSPVHDGGR
jgi:hypothetical protein